MVNRLQDMYAIKSRQVVSKLIQVAVNSLMTNFQNILLSHSCPKICTSNSDGMFVEI